MSLKVVIGLILIAINVPVGWVGAAVFGYRAKKTKHKKYLVVAGLVYAFSWIILFSGIYLCGDAYKIYAANPWFKYGIPAAIFLIVAIIIAKKYLKKQPAK